MCKLGDIIVVRKYNSEDGKEMKEHSFIVVGDEDGVISGLDYSMVASVISSFKGENNRRKKLSYYGNIELEEDAIEGKKLEKPSYVKVDQAYYFNKDKLDYYVFGTINPEYLTKLLKIILDLDKNNKLKHVIGNL